MHGIFGKFGIASHQKRHSFQVWDDGSVEFVDTCPAIWLGLCHILATPSLGFGAPGWCVHSVNPATGLFGSIGGPCFL